MVVQRKTPGAPGAPAASRSSSTQALPKTSKDPLSPPRVTPPTVDDVKSRNKHHRKSKLHEVTQTSSISSAAKKVKKPWLPTRFFILLLTIFSIYSLSTCPHDYHRVSPICRSLDVYKNTILEPYLVPSLRHISHLAKPYTEPLKPYTDPVKEFAETQVVPRVRFVKERVIEDKAIPFYKEYVVQRLFKGYLKPTWRKHVQPHLEPYLAPIKAQYQKHVLPIWHTTQKHVTLYYKQAQPYIESAIQHGQTTYVYVRYHSQRTWRVVKPRIIQAYAYTKPRAIKAWKQAKPYLCRAVAEVKSKASDAGRFLGQHRRTYVDPHVRRIWEKVVEPSNGTGGTVGNAQAEETPEAVPTTQPVQETEEVIPTTPAASPIPVQTPEPEQETVAANADEPEEPSTPAPAATAEATPAEQVQVEEVAAPELSEPAAHVPVTEEAAASAASIVAESLHPESTPIAGVSAEPTEGFPEDVDDFLKDLGFGDEDDLSAPPSYSEEADEAVFTPAEELLEADSSEAASSSKMPPAEPTGQPSFNQEPSPEEKLRLTAQKREEIVTRHERHEKELKEFVETMEKEAREVVAAARDEGVHGLLTWSSEEEMNGQGKGVMKEIEEETSKFMKGLEGYVRSSEKRLNHLVTSGGSADSVRKAVKSEKIKFDNVLAKTHAKFSERLQAMQLKVGQFVQDIRGKEKEEIDLRSKEVMKMAEEAQGDLALDYAWLDDVSYWDWQRYHDLVRVAENFTALLNALHSNDHDSLSSYHLSTPLPDPLVDTLMTLEQEVQEVVDGFEVWVEGITRKGKEAMQGFADRLPAETTPAATTATPEKQKTVRFGHAVPSAKGRASILPIAPSDPGSVPTQTGTPELDENAQHIFLSRSKEEVEERVKGLNVDREEL